VSLQTILEGILRSAGSHATLIATMTDMQGKPSYVLSSVLPNQRQGNAEVSSEGESVARSTGPNSVAGAKYTPQPRNPSRDRRGIMAVNAIFSFSHFLSA
jgi:hypothetical protein